MAGSRSGWLARRRGRDSGKARLILPPTTDVLVVGGSAGLQRALDSCDRSPALLRLTAAGESVDVLFAGEVVVGQLDPPWAGVFAAAVRRAERRGGQLWAHGQIERRGVELVAVLHCAPPPKRKFLPSQHTHLKVR